MKFLRKKRVFALLFLTFLLLLFYQSDQVGRWLYPIHYEELIRLNAEQYQMDPLLIAAVIRVESNYKPHLVSRKGAVGLMQIMPGTAEWIVSQAGYSSELLNELNRPDINIDMGTWYLHSLSRQFQEIAEEGELDRIAVIASAYNAGPGNVGKWLNTGQWNGRYGQREAIPFGETRHYVERVVYYYNKYGEFYAAKWE